MHELADRLRAAARAYYDSDTLIMTDADYDAGIEQLQAAVDADPSLAADYADLLGHVAAGQSRGGDVAHPSLMGSMSKVPSLEAATDFVQRVAAPVVVEPKLDGLAIRVVYTDGDLTLAATRGNGLAGENITRQVESLQLVPRFLAGTPLDGLSVELRGEVFLPQDRFPAANTIRTTAGSNAFINPRNAAAGILRKGDRAYAGLLTFAVYGVDGLSDDHVDALTQVNGFETSLSLASAAGMTGQPTSSPQQVGKEIALLGEARATLDYPIDGAVIKAVHAADRARLGVGSKSPNWAVAYKYEAAEAESTVVAIHTNVGRTGRLAIQVEIEPVFLDGTTISFASGHNVAWMQERGLRVGDVVKVRRAGDVIPYLSSVVIAKRPADSHPWQPPEVDPMGRPWDKSTLLWRSTSPELSVLGGLAYAVSRDCLDVDGLGSEILAALVDDGVASIADLFTIDVNRLANLTVDSGRVVGHKTAARIVAELQKAKSADWHRVITALGVRATGRTMGRRLAAVFPTMDALTSATLDDLATVEGIGAKKAAIIRDGLDALQSAGVIDRLAACGVTMGAAPVDDQEVTMRPLTGETVVVTGKVGELTRTQVQERVEALGGKASSSVSSSTTLLVADPAATSSKVAKAKKLGVRMMTPDEFLAL